jgi:hypothetical protein
MGNLLTKFLDLEEQAAIKAYLKFFFYKHNYDGIEERIILNKVIINHNFCKNFMDGKYSLKTYILKELNLCNIKFTTGAINRGDLKKYGDYYFPGFFCS